MAKKPKPKRILLRWSEHVPVSVVQDPLGLNLRGLARLGERLLNGITTGTRRARYYSFIPWCVFDYQNREKGKPHALGLRDGIVLRENTLTLACITHHEGDTCRGGGLVGSDEAKRWLSKGNAVADLKTLKFAKNPALNAYFTSLVNLGCFVTEDQNTQLDDSDEEREFTFDDVELSAVGLDLAKRYESMVGALPVVRQFVGGNWRCSVESLTEFGRHGGLCELTEADPADRSLLRELFFGTVNRKGGSHQVRRQSLLLMLELCRQFSAEEWVFHESNFADAVYFGELVTDDERLKIEVVPGFVDISTRWRMFYFHHYMGVALEGLFCWLITQLQACELAGATLEELVLRLDDKSVRKGLSELLKCDLKKPFGQMTPCDFFAELGLPHGDLNAEFGSTFDLAVRSTHPVAEDTLETLVRGNEYLQSSIGLALPMILLATMLMRYSRWETTNYGTWLATVAKDPYLDLIPPVIANSLKRQFGRWWRCKWSDLAGFVLSRYVVRQHQSMSYEKSSTGDRCLLQVDGSKVFSTGEYENSYEKIGMGNPRLGSAIQILNDLGLMEKAEDGVIHLTKDGTQFLEQELKKEDKQ